MADISEAEMKIKKAVKEAKAAHKKLAAELDAKKLDSEIKDINPGKAISLVKMVNGYIKKVDSISKFRNPKVYKLMSPETQDDLDWAGGVLQEMLGHQADLNRTAKLIDKKPQAIIDKILAEIKKRQDAYKGLRTIKKAIEKGYDPVKKEFSGLSVLPALIMLVIMGLTLKRWLDRKS